MTNLHAIPEGDVIDHDAQGDCVCGPTTSPMKNGDGSIWWLHTHYALRLRGQGAEA